MNEPRAPLAPLRIRLFRSLWLAGLVSNIGTYMHTVGAGWAITELTTDPTRVGLLQTMWAAPGFLFALIAGALADVMDRRRLMLVSQLGAMALAGLMGALTVGDHLTVTTLLLLTFLLSVALTLSAPAFMAVTPELVDLPLLAPAIALNSISINLAQAAGPALAGLVIAAAGSGAVFFVNAASFLGIVVVVRGYRPVNGRAAPPEPIVAAMRTGIRYVRQPRLAALMMRLLLWLTVTSSLAALLPLVARQRLGVGAGAFGLLATSGGVGAVSALWVLPRLRLRYGSDPVVAVSTIVWALGAVTVGATSSFAVACGGVALSGGAAMTTMITVFATYQALLPTWVRGRASSVAMLVIWLGTSAGSLGWGYLASRIGIDRALFTAAGAALAVGAVGGWFLRIGDDEQVLSEPRATSDGDPWPPSATAPGMPASPP